MDLSYRRYFAELDGLRALAAWVVVLYHLGVPGLPGSYGVVLFFVLSGFLITLLLLRERDLNGRIDFKSFYIRRSLRIMPAFYVFLLFTVCWKLLRHNPVDTTSLIAAATYTLNYYIAFVGDANSGFSHAWSLAVEEQFYLLWPIAFSILVLRAHRVRELTVIIVAIWCVRILMHLFTSLPNRYYYAAFEQRMDALLVGCALALACSPANGWWKAITSVKRPSLILWSSVAGVIILGLGEYEFGSKYRDTVTAAVLPVLCALIIVSALTMGTRGTLVFLNAKPVVWLGRISYSTYLYQQIVFEWGQKIFPQAPRAVQIGTEIVCVLALACGSYYFVERPIQSMRARYSRIEKPQIANEMPAR